MFMVRFANHAASNLTRQRKFARRNKEKLFTLLKIATVYLARQISALGWVEIDRGWILRRL